MKIELQCSNCGTRLSLNPTDFWKYVGDIQVFHIALIVLKRGKKEMAKNGTNNTMKKK